MRAEKDHGWGRWLREPLLGFLVLGAGFLVLGELWTSRVTRGEERERVEVTAARVEWLQKSFESRWLRPPTETELQALVDDHVRREVLYREALGLGLDRDDEVIRRRMVQKIEYMTEDLASQIVPTEVELLAFFQEHLDDYRVPGELRFQHVYFNVDQRGDAAFEAAEELLAQLRGPEGATLDPDQLGDRLLLEVDDRSQSETEIGRQFGARFAAELFELEQDEWTGPVGSSYGLHLVRVSDVRASRDPTLDEVRDEVLRDYAVTARERASDAIYTSLREGYEIVIDEEAVRALSLEGR